MVLLIALACIFNGLGGGMYRILVNGVWACVLLS
jgi:hypothetical protein